MPRRKRQPMSMVVAGALGGRVRTFRKLRGLTLVELGEAVGVSHSFLSQVEHEKALPSVTTLAEIAKALDVAPAELLGEAEPVDTLVVRAHEASPVDLHGDGRDVAAEARTASHRLAAFTIHGQLQQTERIGHPGEEFLYVLQGSVVIDVGDTEHRLGPGDSIVFDSSTPHVYRSLDGAPIEVVSVSTRPGAPRPAFSAEPLRRLASG